MDWKPTRGDFWRLIKKYFIIGLFLIGLSGMGYYVFAGMTYSEGTRSGVLIKISKKGVLFKTYEGELALSGVGGYMFNPKEQGNVWAFSVKDKSVYQKMDQFEGRAVALDYKETFRTFFWWGETRYFITDVKPIPNPGFLPPNTPVQ